MVEERLCNLSRSDLHTLIHDPCLIDSYLANITEILTSTAIEIECTPPKRFSPHLKPGWNVQLKAAHIKLKQAHTALGQAALVAVTTLFESITRKPKLPLE